MNLDRAVAARPSLVVQIPVTTVDAPTRNEPTTEATPACERQYLLRSSCGP